MLSVFNLAGISYQWKDCDTNTWLDKPEDDAGIEKRINAMYWVRHDKPRLLVMNISVPAVKKMMTSP